MCGIVGYVGSRDAVPIIIEGLRRLEYRGYDSAGVAVVRRGELIRRRAPGKLKNLEESLQHEPIAGEYGVGHTRWATHGRPTEENAHPHQDSHGRIVVVHNGIIENYLPLKTKLQAAGHTFVTQTDTEVIAHLVSHYYDRSRRPHRRPSRSWKGSTPWCCSTRTSPNGSSERAWDRRSWWASGTANASWHRTSRLCSPTPATSCSWRTGRW
jgi:glucosamine 6-phosphate synthetase-like amidotransferase/phosphosugar isomerase protein